VNYALRQLGKNEVDTGTVTGYAGDGVRKLLERVLGDAAKAELEAAHRYFRSYYHEHIADDLLLFDRDGTHRFLASAVNYTLRQLGKSEVDMNTVAGYVGDGVRKLWERVLGDAAETELEAALRYFRFYYHGHAADDLLFFERDGTRRDLANAVNYVLRQLGRDEADMDFVTGYASDGVRRFLARMLADAAKAELEAAHRHFLFYYREHIADDLLLFDFDGPLVGTRRDLANAVNYALRRLGKNEIDVDTVTSYVGGGVRKLFERARGDTAKIELETALRHFRSYYHEHIADFSQPYPGVREMLEHFDDKQKAILTNKPQEFTEALLRRLGMRRHFAMVVGGQPDLKLKPDPEAVLKILRHFSLTASRAVIIGDGENDILAGKAAEIATCAVAYGFRPVEKLRALQPDFVIKAPAELMGLII
jgi:phosphoglycolate phosphatase